jgi:hypothetical protein
MRKLITFLLLSLWLALLPANAGWQSRDSNYNVVIGIGGGGFSLVFNSSALSGSPLSGFTYDYGTLAYSPGATRVIVANLWAGSGSPTITGITIGGVALAQVSGAYVTSSSNGIDVWESTAALGGSSGDVQVTYSTALSFTSSVVIYSLTTTTPIASAAAVATSGTTTVAQSIAVPSGGGALIISGNVNGDAATVTNGTLDVDTRPGGFHAWFGHTTSTGTVSVSATYGSGGNSLSLVSWAP